MRVTPVHTAIFKEKQDLVAFILRHIPTLENGAVLVVSSKLICLWKGTCAAGSTRRQKEKLIRRESDAALKTKLAWMTLKEGMLMTNAGIDESNARGKWLLLPPRLYACAAQLRAALCRAYGIKKLGLIITDSMILPLRAGVIGAAVAYAGFCGVRDERGKKDIFGKPLEMTLVNLADALAAAAAVTMGERNERRPLCVITGAPVKFAAKTDPAQIQYPPEQDLYAPLLKAVGLVNRRKND